MGRISMAVVVGCVLFLLVERVGAQPTMTLAPLLTHTEQARLLGLVTSKSKSSSFLLKNSSDYHITQAKSLLNEMDQLKPDGTRSGNPLFKKVLFHLEGARQAGVSYESSLNQIYRESSRVPALVQLRKQALLNNMKSCRQLGLVTPENMQRLEQGLAPVVTKGNAKYIGETVEVDHSVPIRGPIGRAVYENEPANLQMLPKSINREKRAFADTKSPGREAKLDRAYLMATCGITATGDATPCTGTRN